MELNQNEFLASLFNLIIQTRVNRTVNGQRINELIDACMVDPIEYGEGAGLISVDTLETEDYSKTSSLLTNKEATLDEQQLETTDKKLIHVTINRYLMKGAFKDEYSMSECIGTITEMLEKTKLIYVYKKIVSAYQNWSPTLATQVVEIELTDGTGMVGAELNENNKANALAIYSKVRELSLNLQSPSRDYNDLEYEEMYNANEMDFIVNGKFDSLINTHAYASLLNSDKLNNIQLYDKSIIIPKKQFSTPEAQEFTIGYLVSKKKYMIAPRFTVSASFFDASNLNDQEFLHFWLNSAFVNGLAGIKLVAKFVAPEA